MRWTIPSVSTSLAALLLALVATTPVAPQEGKPLLSEEIRRALDEGGPEAAKRRFDEIVPARQDDYEVDLEGMSGLAMERMSANDMESGQVVMEMVAALGRAQMASYMPETAEAARAQQEADRAAAASAETAAPTPSGPGPARDDLKRFAGYYGPPPEEGKGPRNLWALETCDGYLLAGASWGDASPWHLTSVGETRFEYRGPYRSFTIEFEVDGDGTPVAMIHDMEDLDLPARLPYRQPLEDDQCYVVERRGPE